MPKVRLERICGVCMVGVGGTFGVEYKLGGRKQVVQHNTELMYILEALRVAGIRRYDSSHVCIVGSDSFIMNHAKYSHADLIYQHGKVIVELEVKTHLRAST